MRWIVRTSLNYRFLVVAVGTLLMALGVAILPSTRVDAFPEFAPPRVVIQTACLGLSTSDVEQLVTVPLEQALNGVDGLDDMRSKSVPQLSAIELIFKPDVDELKARQLVQERMTAVASSLPTWAAPPVMLAPVSATGRAMQIGMTSKDHSLIQMSMSAYWTIRARLLQVPGVANVALWGERLQMMQVQVEPPKMEARHVALNEVMEATADAVDSGLLRFSNGSIIGTGGMVESPNQRINVQNVLPIITPDDLAKVPLHVEGTGKGVKIGDIGRVVEDHQPLIGDAVINDSPGLLLVVEKLPWANTVEMTKGVEDAIRSLEPGLPGVQFDTTIFQQANFITAAIQNLTQALVLGFVLVIVILALFLFEWRVALISLLTIPLSLMATLLVLHWRGETVNTMTLAGLVIALGAVVDDAIIDVENIVRRLRQHRLSGSQGSTASVILSASLEVRGADRLRHHDHRRSGRADLSASGTNRRVLPPARAVIHPRDCGLVARRLDRDPRAGADPAEQVQDRAATIARGRGTAARLHSGSDSDRCQASTGVRDLRPGYRGRHRADATPWPVALSGLQGTRLPYSLGQPAGNLS
jgi:Cu/Ag efflux pump CusA